MHDMNRVELVIPASPEYVVLARLTAAGIASRVGLSFDDIEDLRVVAAEMCRLLVGEEHTSKGTITLTYRVGDGSLEIEAIGETDPPTPTPSDDDLSVHLLSALADEHEVEVAGGKGRVRVVKRLLA